MAISDILVTGGVAAMIAAVAGGGLRVVNVDLPLINSFQRQAALFMLGLVFSLAGWSIDHGAIKDGDSDRAKSPAKITLAPADRIDFRPSKRTDLAAGYLLITVNMALRSDVQSGEAVVWTHSDGKLYLGSGPIPFRAVNFTNLTEGAAQDEKIWLGEGATAAHPVVLKPGESVQHDLMFMPIDAGFGLFPWQRFVDRVFVGKNLRPKFVANFYTKVGERDGPTLSLECTAGVETTLEANGGQLPPLDSAFWVAAVCEQ